MWIDARVMAGAIVPACLLATSVAAGHAQEAFIVVGDVEMPVGLRETQRLEPGTTIIVGPNGLVVIEQKWQDAERRPCVSWIAVSASTYTVADEERSGSCPLTGEPSALNRFTPGEAFVARMVFYDLGLITVLPDSVDVARTPKQRALLRLRQIADDVATTAQQAARIDEERADAERRDAARRQAAQDAAERRAALRDFASPADNDDLTGTWVDEQNQGMYYLRQDGNRIWWYGRNRDARRWSHVFSGTRYRDLIEGEWVDVPPATGLNGGRLSLRIGPRGSPHVIEQAGGFVTSVLVRMRSP